jgi:hypothetical protein
VTVAPGQVPAPPILLEVDGRADVLDASRQQALALADLLLDLLRQLRDLLHPMLPKGVDDWTYYGLLLRIAALG